MNKTITEQLQEIAEDFCNHYCKYPDTWDEEAERCKLSDWEVDMTLHELIQRGIPFWADNDGGL